MAMLGRLTKRRNRSSQGREEDVREPDARRLFSQRTSTSVGGGRETRNGACVRFGRPHGRRRRRPGGPVRRSRAQASLPKTFFPGHLWVWRWVLVVEPRAFRSHCCFVPFARWAFLPVSDLHASLCGAPRSHQPTQTDQSTQNPRSPDLIDVRPLLCRRLILPRDWPRGHRPFCQPIVRPMSAVAMKKTQPLARLFAVFRERRFSQPRVAGLPPVNVRVCHMKRAPETRGRTT
ncbi:hypothetical protein VUR80DRAFT_3807 [Thermomyces stellatus]